MYKCVVSFGIQYIVYLCPATVIILTVVEDNTSEEDEVKTLNFNEIGDKAGQDKARMNCPTKDISLQLIGDKIFEPEKLYFKYSGLWVDLSRVQTDIVDALGE